MGHGCHSNRSSRCQSATARRRAALLQSAARRCRRPSQRLSWTPGATGTPAAPSKAQPPPLPALELGGERPNRDYKRMAMLAILPNRRVLSQQGLRVIWAEGDVMESFVKVIWEFYGIVLGADEDKSSAYLAIPAATSMDQLPGGRSSPRPRSSFLIGRGTPRTRSAASWPLHLRRSRSPPRRPWSSVS
jgi:hypothetical protein